MRDGNREQDTCNHSYTTFLFVIIHILMVVIIIELVIIELVIIEFVIVVYLFIEGFV